MNKVQEYLIRNKAIKDAKPFVDKDKYEKQLFENEALIRIAELQYNRLLLQREYISTPDAESRELDEQTMNKIQLALGGIGVAGAVVGCLATGNNDLATMGISSAVAGLSSMALGGVGMMVYEANPVNKVVTAIKRNRLKRNIASIDRSLAKENLYRKTVQGELER